jgi:nitrate reductase NapE component
MEGGGQMSLDKIELPQPDARPEAQPQLQQTQKRRRRRWLLLFLLVACLLPVVALGFSEEFSWLIEKIKGTIFGPQKTSWQQLAKAVRAQNPTPHEILEKLQLLFEPDRSAAAVAPAEPPEPKIEKLLQAFEKAMGRSGKEKLQTLSQSPKLLEELQKLFPQGEFDPMGLVLVEGLPRKTAQFWRSLLPPVFDKLQNSLAQAAKSPDLWQLPKMPNDLLAALGLKEQMPCYVKIFKVLADYTPSQGPNHPEQMGPQRRFYVPNQRDSLATAYEVLTSICQACKELKKQELKTSSASSGTSQEEAPCEDNVKDCLETIVATLQERLPGAIENTNKVPNPDEKNLVKLRQALETLQKLVNEWKGMR